MADNKLVIELGSKLAGDFGSAFKSAKGRIGDLNKSLGDLKKQQSLVKRFEMQTADLTTAKQKLDAANEAVRQLRVEVQKNPTKKLREEFTRANEKAEKLRVSLNNQRADLGKTRTAMQAAGLSTKNTAKTLDDLGKAIDRVAAKSKKLQGFKQQQAELAQGFGELKSKAMGAFASIASTTVAVKPAFDFQAAASELQAKSAGMADDQRKLLEGKARELGRTMRFTATEAMQGMTFLSMAGFDPQEIEAAASGMLNLAQSAGMGLAQTADIASNILSGFKLEATEMDRAADVLAYTFTTSNVTLHTLGETMKYVAPVATAAGQSIEQMAVMTGMLGDVGIQGSNAGTALRAALLRLADPPKKAAAALNDLGVATMDAQGNMRAMPEILGDIQKSTEGMGNGEILAKISQIFGVEAAAALTELVSSSENITAKYNNLMENAAGTTGRVAKTMGDNAKGAIIRMGSAFNDLGITLGNVFLPYVQSAAEGIAGFVGKVSAFLTENPRFAQALGVAAAAIVTVTTAGVAVGATILAFKASMLAFGPVIGGVTAAFTGLTTVFPLVAGGIKAIGLALVANPIGLAVAAVAAGAALIITNWESVGPFFDRVWGGIQTAGGNVVDWWNNTTFTEKALDVSSIGVEAALFAATSFFDWWDSSTLKQHSPEFVVNGIESAKQLTNTFFDWWDGTTFEEKVVGVATGTLEVARTAGDAFVGWWDSTTLQEKALGIATVHIGLARTASESFFSWWDGSELKQHAPDFAVDGIEMARTKSEQFFDWWDNASLKQKAVDIVTAPLVAARSASESFFSWWDDSTLKAHTPDVVTDAIDGARETAGRFVGWWNDTSLKQKVSDVTYTAVTGAWNLSRDFDTWWDSWTLAEVAASVNDSLLSQVWDLAQRFSDWWNKLELKSLIPDIQIPGLGDVKTAVSDTADAVTTKAGEMADSVSSTISGLWGRMKRLGSDAADGLAQGLQQSTSHIDAAHAAAQSVEDAARETLDTHSPSKVMESVGSDAADGAAVGLTKGGKAIATAAAKAAQKARDAFDQTMRGLKQQYIQFTQGDEAARRYELSMRDMTVANIDAVITAEAHVKALQKQAEIQKKVDEALQSSRDALMLANVEWREGADAAKVAALELEGFSEAGAKSKVAIDKETEALKKNIQTRQKVADALKASRDGLRLVTIERDKGKDAAKRAALELDGFSKAEAASKVAIDNETEALRKNIQLREKVADALKSSRDALRLVTIERDKGKDAAKQAALELEGFSKAEAASKVAIDNETEALRKNIQVREQVAEALKASREALRLVTIERDQGKDAAKRAALELEGFSKSEAAAKVAIDNETASLRKNIAARDQARDAVNKLAKQQEYERIKLTDTAEAAELYRLKTEGYTEALALSQIQHEKNIELLQKQGEINRTVNEGLTDSIMSAVETGKLSFSSLKDHLKQTFNNMILRPVIQAVMQPISNMIGNAMGGVGQSLSGLLGGGAGGGGILSSLFGGGSGGGIGGMISSGLSSVGGFISNAFGGIGSSITGALGSVFGGIGSTLGGIGSSVLGSLGGVGSAISGALGGVGSALGGITAALGPIGIAAGILSLGFGKKKTTGTGVQVGYSDGAGFAGQNYEDWKKKKWFKYRTGTDYSDMDAQGEAAIQDYFTNMNSTIAAQAEAMGVKNADNLLKGFKVATVKLSGEDIEGQLKGWLSDTSGKAYKQAFTKLPLALKQAIDPAYKEIRTGGIKMGGALGNILNLALGAVNRTLGQTSLSAEELTARFQYVGAVAQTVQPALESIGINLAESETVWRGSFWRIKQVTREVAGSATKNAVLLTDALGGMEPAMQKIKFAYDNLAPATDKFSNQFIAVRDQVEQFNTQLGLTGSKAILTKEALWEHIQGLDATTEKGRAAAAAAFDVAGAMTTFAGAIQGIKDMFSSTITNIENDLLTQQEKQAKYMAEAEALFNQLKAESDPGKIAEMSEKINAAVQNAWSNMTAEQKAANADYLKTMLQASSDLASEQMKGAMSNADLMKSAISSMDKPVAGLASASTGMGSAATTMTSAAGGMQSAAGSMAAAAASIPRTIDVNVNSTVTVNQVPADGSHATGLTRVPKDGYRAILHKNELVATSNEASLLRSGAPVMMDAARNIVPADLLPAANDSGPVELPPNVLPIQKRAEAVLKRTQSPRQQDTRVVQQGDTITLHIHQAPGQSSDDVVRQVQRLLKQRDADKRRRQDGALHD